VRQPLAVTGWSVVSPLGMGARVFSDGFRDGVSAVRPCQDESSPVRRTAEVPGFAIREVLGRKNTRSMDRATGLAVTTVGMLLRDGLDTAGQDIGLVLGTTTGSVQSMMDFTKDSLTQDKPFLVDPARFPNTVMNCAAGQCAIWHGLRGPNATIAGGQTTGLAAMNYAARLHHCGRAETVLCGAVEEFSLQRAWLEKHARAQEGEPVLGEGCAVFQIESAHAAAQAGRAVLADLLSVTLRVHNGDPADVLAQSVRTGLTDAGVGSDEVWAVAGDPASTAGLDLVFGAGKPWRIDVEAKVADTGAASGAMQLAALLAVAEHEREATGKNVLVTSVDRDGAVGCAVLRLHAATKREES
jgi:3-oxoacyl-[acyl-carrier-protein] synthase II